MSIKFDSPHRQSADKEQRLFKAEFWGGVGAGCVGKGTGLHAETAQSALTVTLKLVISHINVISIVLSTVNLELQDWFVPISLRPILGIVAVYVMAIV